MDNPLAHSSFFFFTLEMDELTWHIQIKVLCNMLFRNNIVMIDKMCSRVMIHQNLERAPRTFKFQVL